ncbi:MAG TPA: hypothetical protein VJS44_22370 [Pyrinomonadaceae bacterium]|nr:hypothetical protein [Pyrinomonadaceae bacterium]
MKAEVWVSLLSFGGTLLLVVTGLLNFSIFRRQLRYAQEQMETARQQLEHAQKQPEILLIQRAMTEMSEHLPLLIERPYLRPYFYESKLWREGDQVNRNELLGMAELLLDNFASAIIHSASFPQYPIRGVEQSIRFHLQNSPALREFLMENFDRFQLAGLALLRLKNKTVAETEEDLRRLIGEADTDEREKARRERLLGHFQINNDAEPLELAKYSIQRRAVAESEMLAEKE